MLRAWHIFPQCEFNNISRVIDTVFNSWISIKHTISKINSNSGSTKSIPVALSLIKAFKIHIPVLMIQRIYRLLQYITKTWAY